MKLPRIKKSYLFSLILILVVILAGAFYYVNNFAPQKFVSGFAGEAVAPELSSFSEYYRAQVVAVTHEEIVQYGNSNSIAQIVKVRFLNGSEKGKELEIDNKNALNVTEQQKLKEGDKVVVGKLQNNPEEQEQPFVIIDKYRLPAIALIVGLFFGLALIFGRMRGATSIVGLAFSIFLLIYFVAPNIIAGKDPLLVSLVGACLIIMVSIFLAHGFNERSGLATISTFITLTISVGMAWYFVSVAKLFGLGSGDAFYLQSGLAGSLNLRGLLLGGIIIGTLGILDDVTTTQTGAIDEIHKANPNLSFRELYSKGVSVGKEHIASLINTLVLAYAGASLPLFLLFTITTNQPIWSVLNSEFIAEELIRTLVGSSALILAVPLSTLLATYYYSYKHEE